MLSKIINPLHFFIWNYYFIEGTTRGWAAAQGWLSVDRVYLTTAELKSKLTSEIRGTDITIFLWRIFQIHKYLPEHTCITGKVICSCNASFKSIHSSCKLFVLHLPLCHRRHPQDVKWWKLGYNQLNLTGLCSFTWLKQNIHASHLEDKRTKSVSQDLKSV